jgi:hypothetical protein
LVDMPHFGFEGSLRRGMLSMFGREDFRIAREAHYERFLGQVSCVAHSRSVNLLPLHIDVYQFAPTAARRCWTLITGGMSDFRQPALEGPPPGIAPRAELLMYVKQVQGWMPSLLKALAEMPFERATCLHWAHTMPNGQPITEGANELTGFFFCPPICETEKFEDFSIDGDRVAFLMVVPITDAERVYCIEHGSAALGKLMEDTRFNFVVDEKRASLV